MSLKKIAMLSAALLTATFSNSHAGTVNIFVDGETPASVFPKITALQKTSSDFVKAEEGVLDMYTPLQITGNLKYKFDTDTYWMNVSIDSMYTMQQIANMIGGGGYPGPYYPPMPPAPGQMNSVILKEVHNDKLENVLAIQANMPSKRIQIDTTELSFPMAPVQFGTSDSKMITASIFPVSSTRAKEEMMAKYKDSRFGDLILYSENDSIDIGNATYIFQNVKA